MKPPPSLAGNETFQVEVIGERVGPVEVGEEVPEAERLFQPALSTFLNKSNKSWKRRHLLDLPGGIVLIGGNAIFTKVL